MLKWNKILILLLLLTTFACEEVVDVELEESEPRLVIEASLVWDASQNENPLFVRLTTTAPYFDEEIPPAENAQVTVYDEHGKEYLFEEVETGLFRNDGFTPESDLNYELEVTYKNEIYRATEQIVATPEIETIEQNNNGGFLGDEIELRAYYTDPANVDNYYLFKFYYELLSLQIYNDDLTDGNRTFALFSEDELEPGDEVVFEIQGITRGFYDYLNILRSQAGSGGGPFQTQPTVVRGNIVNTTNPDNYAFGYFRLSEKHTYLYQVQ